MTKLFSVKGNRLFAGNGEVPDDNQFTRARLEETARLSRESIGKRRSSEPRVRRETDREWLSGKEYLESLKY